MRSLRSKAAKRKFHMTSNPPLTSDAKGRGVRVAVIDSGVHAAHSHIGNVAGGVSIRPDGALDEGVYPDLLGHGTAVMAAIQEKAPEADYFAVRVFQTSLRTTASCLLRAID